MLGAGRGDARASVATVELLAAIADDGSHHDPARAAARAVDALVAAVTPRVVAVLALRDGALVPVATRGWPVEGATLAPSDALGPALRAATATVLDALAVTGPPDVMIGRALVAPIMGHGALWGAIVVGRDHAEPAAATSEDEAAGLVSATARILGATLAAGQREAIARATADHWQAIVDCAGHAVFIATPDGDYVDVNRTGEALLGYPRDELLTRNVGDVLVASPEEPRPQLARLSSSQALTTLRRLRRKDKSIVEVEISAQTLPDGRLVGVVHDRAGRDAANARFRQALRAARAGAWEWSVVTSEATWSEENFDVLGLDPTTTRASFDAWLAAIHPDDREAATAGVGRALADGADLDIEFRVVHPDGAVRWLRDVGQLVKDAAGAPVSMYGIQIDVTEQHLTEQARQRAEVRLNSAERLDALGRLAGGIAHDFNNLLTVIAMSATVAKSAGPPAEIAEDLDAVLDAAERARTLTRQLQAFGRRQAVAPTPIDLGARIAALEPMLRRLIEARIRITVEIPPTPLLVVVDPGQLDQVVLNLALNARDAMPGEGALDIVVSAAELEPAAAEVRGLTAGRHARIAVSDSGVGIDDETLRHLFEPFYTTKPVDRGTGMGLATVHGVVEQLGGHIEVETALGDGTTFTVWLAATDGEARRAPRPTPDYEVRPGRILAVEDDPHILALIKRVLAARGHVVLGASSGPLALALARSTSPGFDLLVVDVGMAEMSGPELVRQLGAAHGPMPTLFMTGYLDATLARHGLDGETVRVLAKPFTPAELVRRVSTALAMAQPGTPVSTDPVCD